MASTTIDTAFHRVPVTLRDSFWDDPFFSNFWADFENMRKELWKDHKDFFTKFEEEARNMSESRCKMSSSSSSSSSSTAVEVKNQQSKDMGTLSNWFMPSRRWMLPKDFFNEAEAFKMSSFQGQNEVIRVKDDDKGFEVSLDTHDYKPHELTVKIANHVITVEGKHEQEAKCDGSQSFQSRQFSRKYNLPKGCEMEKVTSNLSTDGVLIITAPKETKAVDNSQRSIPIQMSNS